MAESKLENLVSRLEKVVSHLESGSQGPKPASAASSLPSLEDFNTLISEFEQLGNKLDLIELHEMTVICLNCFNAMKKVMEYSTNGKANADQKKEIQTTFMGLLKKFSSFGANVKVNLHSKAVGEAINAVFWVVSETPEMLMKGCIESSEFHGLKLRNLKVQPHIKWYDALIISLKNLSKYVVSNFPMGLNWNPKGTADFKTLIADLNNNDAKAKAVETEQPVPSRAAMFQQLNQGENITSNLKKVTSDMKNKPVQDIPKRLSVSKKEEKKEETAAPVKPPRKHKRENWFVENFTDEKLIEFPDNECDIRESIFVDNCKNLCIMVNAKVKSIFISKCVKLNLIFKSVLSTVECVNSRNIEIICIDNSPTINIDKCESIHVCLPPNLNSDVVSAKTSALNITYKLPDGEYEKDTPVPEQLVTKWDAVKKRFVSKPLDLFM